MSIRTLSNSLLVVVAMGAFSCAGKKTGFVDVFKLVQGFELQKEYTAQARKEYDRARAAMDSAVAAEKLRDSSQAKALKSELYSDLDSKTGSHAKEIEQMIWTRLNPYITDFGKEKGYSYIYGANGTGTMLYASPEQDITEEVIQYVNTRYHGKK